MSVYYTAKRTKGTYDPVRPGSGQAREAFKLSRSKIDLFMQCPRCFYLDRRIGIGRPPGFPFALNSAVDYLLKKEFDTHRAAGSKHPLMEKYGIDAVPAKHEKLDEWRHNFTGVGTLHAPTNFYVFGAIDDLWLNAAGEYMVVDYKATAKEEEINALDKDWHDGYKRQMEIYQWLLRQNGFTVSNTGYFVYCNGKTDRKAFDGKLDFDITLIAYTGNSEWVDKALVDAKACLDKNEIPKADGACDYCAYVSAVEKDTRPAPDTISRITISDLPPQRATTPKKKTPPTLF